MALFRKGKTGKLLRTFDPSNKERKATPDRVIQDFEDFKTLVTQTANRIKAIEETKIDQAIKDRFIAAEYAKLGYSINSITTSK